MPGIYSNVVFRVISSLTLAACAALALCGKAPAPLLPSMSKHLAEAESALEQGDLARAEALSQLIKPSVIKVEIDVTKAPFSQKLACLRSAKKAMEVWQELLDGAVTFEVVPATQAQVRMQFLPEVCVGGAPTAGRAEITRQLVSFGWGAYGHHLSGTLQVRTQSSGQNHTESALTHTASHELGHILGLADSGEPEGSMGALRTINSLELPTKEEASSLNTLYAQAQQLLLRAQSGRTR